MQTGLRVQRPFSVVFAMLVATGFSAVLFAAAAPDEAGSKQSEPPETNETSCTMDNRFERGLTRLDEITQGQGRRVLDSISRTSPDLARYVVEYPYGDVACRPGLTDQQRQLAIISALAAMGFAQPELRVHMHGALNVGVSEQEIIEAMILISVYAGFPASLHGLRAAEAVFAERAESE